MCSSYKLGRCNNFTKSKDLRVAISGSGDSTQWAQHLRRLYSHVHELLMAIAVPPNDLRGVSICMSKLSVAVSYRKDPRGSINIEETVKTPQSKGDVPNCTANETSSGPNKRSIDGRCRPTFDAAKRQSPTMDSSIAANNDGSYDDLSWTQVDPTVLASLPEDIRLQQVEHLNRQKRAKRLNIVSKGKSVGADPHPWWQAEVGS